MSKLGHTIHGKVAHILPREWMAVSFKPALCGVVCCCESSDPSLPLCKRCVPRADPPNQSSIIGENRR